MDTQVMLICCYGNVNAAINLQAPFRFDDMVNCACEKFPGLTPAQVCLFFKILGYNNFILHNDVDVESMVSLAWSFRLQCIDVIIQLQESRDADNAGSPVHNLQTVPCHTAGVFDDSDMDDEQELLENFCPHIDKVFLSAPWANGIQHVGQSFQGGASKFRNVLRKYAVECGFRFEFVKNDSVRITAVCTMRESRGCMWFVHARVLHANGFFYLRKWNSEHICGVAVRTPKNPRAGSDLVSDVICERVCDKPLTRPTDVVYDLKKDYGLEVSYRVAWLGVEKARGEMFGAHSISFDQLRWYSSVVMENNPGSYINIEYDEQNYRFIRYFISFKACIDGFNHCRPLLFLDGTFLKGKFKGNLLAATAKDGNQGLFPVAIAIVDSENTTNWAWFLEHLANVVNRQRTLTFVSDRHAGLLESIPIIFPTAKHAFCLQHLQRNLQDKLRYVNSSYRSVMLAKFRACAYAPTVAAFNQSMEEFTKCGHKVVPAFLKDLPPYYWANAYFQGSRYGEMSSNAIESFNSWIREARHLPITQMIDNIRAKIIRQMAKRRREANTWAGVICPKMEARLVKAYNKGRSWLVSQSNDDVYEVHSFPSVMVDVGRRTCSYFKWQINDFPCAHAVVAIRNSGLNLYQLVIPYYHVAEYQNSYAQNITPIPTVEKPQFDSADFVIHPSAVKRPPGRPKKKRMLSKGEQVQQIRCGRCQRMGNHNRKTCKEPI
ncbi:uncharacterized protein LOC114302737 [Camellia sinensis]|uniref:uncharacterized protein LOC114302737 n=1 Tax=Camellia sinensis TaxID=4442 RepID=UPI001036A9AC|nr:uncharacterized protein LOC114302737 [Camellia sinensis]